MTTFPMPELTPEKEVEYKIFPINLTKMLLRTKSSTVPFLKLGASFRDAHIPANFREAVIIRCAALLDCPYELVQHRPEALRFGNSEAVVNAITDVLHKHEFDDPAIATLMGYVDSAVKNIEADDASLDAVRKHFSDDQVAEITLIIGHYVMNAIFVKSLRVPLDAGAADWNAGMSQIKTK